MPDVPDRRPPDRPSSAIPDEGALVERLLVNLERLVRHLGPGPRRQRASELLQGVRHAASLSTAERDALVMQIRRFCHTEDLPEVLSLSGLPVVYNFQAEFEDN